MTRIALMICYARSGGTLLSRCLGSLPDVVLVSEVSPECRGRKDGGKRTIGAQAESWYGVRIDPGDYVGEARDLAAHCEAQGKRLVVRDWTVASFVQMRANGNRPSGRLLAVETLAQVGNVRAFVFVRDAIDIWISNGCHRSFFGAYRKYIDAVLAGGLPVFKYESFCARPDETMREICEVADLEFSPAYRNYCQYGKVTGDTALGSLSRGVKADGITVFPRVRIPLADARWVNACADMHYVNRAMGYPDRYEGRALESWFRGLVRIAAWRADRLLSPWLRGRDRLRDSDNKEGVDGHTR